jgi:hypothetical protein
LEKNKILKEAFLRVSELLLEESELKKVKIDLDPVEILASHFVTKAYGIIGFPRFLDGPYLYLITKKSKLGSILKGKVYKIEEVVLEMVLNKQQSCLSRLGSLKDEELRYIDYFKMINCKNCYFSYSIDMTNRIQTILESHMNKTFLNYESKYFWNMSLLEQFQKQLNISEIILPIICGFFHYQKIRIGSKDFSFGLVSRR